MQTAVLLLMCSLTLVACAAPVPPAAVDSTPAPAQRFAILPAAAGPAAFGSCSPTPGADQQWMPDRYWDPDPGLIAGIESRLPALLDSILPLMGRSNSLTVQPRSDQYLRQHVGFERGGQRLVYVNGFHEVLLRTFREQGADGRPFLDWRSAALAPCDAGATVFGVVYDPRTQSFERLEFAYGYGGPVRY